jgi:hypothetical protein
MSKEKIPTHDPFTGELNPYYEAITGLKNPFTIEQDKPGMDKEELARISKEIMYIALESEDDYEAQSAIEEKLIESFSSLNNFKPKQ